SRGSLTTIPALTFVLRATWLLSAVIRSRDIPFVSPNNCNRDVSESRATVDCSILNTFGDPRLLVCWCGYPEIWVATLFEAALRRWRPVTVPLNRSLVYFRKRVTYVRLQGS